MLHELQKVLLKVEQEIILLVEEDSHQEVEEAVPSVAEAAEAVSVKTIVKLLSFLLSKFSMYDNLKIIKEKGCEKNEKRSY